MHSEPSRDIPTLSGKVIMVTGGNAGIGAATVKALATHTPACICLSARNISSASEVVESARTGHPDLKVEVMQLDLASFESIKACANEVIEKSERLDVLLLNAGIAGVAVGLMKEGYESHVGVNHLREQFRLSRFYDRQKSYHDVRIVATTSLMAHKSSPDKLHFDQAHNADAFNSAMQRYGHSKLANIHFARKLSQLYSAITSVSQHLGIVQTEGYIKADRVGIPNFIVRPFLAMFGTAVDKGAYDMLWCATVQLGAGYVQNGEYCEPVGKQVERSKKAVDDHITDELWDWRAKELAKHGAPGWPWLQSDEEGGDM